MSRDDVDVWILNDLTVTVGMLQLIWEQDKDE
jgi:hypothetical protein